MKAMKISKFLSVAFFITSVSLLYVHQQTEIFRLAYVGQKRHTLYQDLLDKNTILRYNIKNYASLVRIGNKISASADFQMPENYRLVRMATSGEATKVQGQPVRRQTVLSRLFSIKRQAEAKTINP